MHYANILSIVIYHISMRHLNFSVLQTFYNVKKNYLLFPTWTRNCSWHVTLTYNEEQKDKECCQQLIASIPNMSSSIYRDTISNLLYKIHSARGRLREGRRK